MDDGWPPRATSFVGRAEDLAALLDELAAPPRLVTLVGLGGAGKTRLALEVAHAVRGGGRPAVWVDMAAARSLDDLAACIAGALGVGAGPRTDAAAVLGALAERLRAAPNTLLVLDGLDALARSAGEHVLALSERGEAAVLVTSREVLFVRGEVRRSVGALPVGEGVQLFRERATARRHGARLDDEVLATLVARLDGLPLAIELAAARIDVLSPEKILESLDRRFELLRTREGGVPERHSALLAVIESSCELLPPELREALARLSVFAPGFDLDSAAIALGWELPAVLD